MTLQEPRNPPIAHVDIPDTEVIVVAHPSPVFVDSTGRRRRLLKRAAYGFGALCMVYGGLISVSLAGGPVSSSAVLPLPALADDGEEDVVMARPSPTPEPPTAAPTRHPILEMFPRRAAPAARTTEAGMATLRSTSATPERSRTPSAGPTTKPSTRPTAVKPIESATTQPSTPESTPPTTETTTPVPPVPPAVPTTSTGGGGGGATDEGDDQPVDPPATEAPAEDPADTDPPPTATTTSKPEPEPEPRPEPEPEPDLELDLELDLKLEPEPEPSGEATA